MGNVLSDDKKQQVIALGRLGWSLRRIEAGDGRPPGDGERLPEGGGHRGARPGRAAAGVAAKTGHYAEVSTDPEASKPAITGGVHRLRHGRRATALRPAARRARAPASRTAS